MGQGKYDVFISYSRKDYVDEQKNVIPGNVVSTVIDFLTSEGVSYWFDKKGISYGDLFTKIIPEKIEQAKLFLFISTQNSNNSLWTAREIKYASDKKKRIIVLRADNTPLTSEIDFLTTTNNRVNYFENPKEELKRTVESIKHYLADKALEEQERDRQRKEQEEKARILKEQEQLIQEITVSCESLKNEEYRVKIERQKLLLRTDKILDKERKTSIQDAILNSSPIRKKYMEEIKSLQKTNENLKTEKESITILLAEEDNALKDKDETLKELRTQLIGRQRSLSSAEQEIVKIRQAYETLQIEKQQLEKLATDTAQQLKTAKVDFSRISDRQKAYQTRINNLEKENSDLFIAVEKYKKQLGQMHHYHPSVWRIVLLGVVIGSVICSILFFIVNSCVGHDTTNSDLVSCDSVVKKAVAIDFYSVVDSSVAISYGPESKRVYKYTGIVSSKSKLPEGRGEAKYNDGSVYNGCFKNGLSDDSISAVLTFKDGDFFKGTFSKGYYVKGIYTYKDKSYYEGTYKNGKKDNGVFCEKGASPRYFKNGVEVTGSAALNVKKGSGL